MNFLKPNTAEAGISSRTVFISWISLFVLKLILSYVYCQMTIKNYPELTLGSISYYSGDHYSYMGAMENYIETGNYYFVNFRGDTVRAGRSPHYSIPYWVFRQTFSPGTSADLSAALYVLLDTCAIICLAIIAFFLASKRRFVYFLALLLGAASTYISNWSINTVPDGPAASLLMIGLFYYWKAYTSDQKTGKNLFFASVFFSWSVVLRPFLLTFIAVFALIFLWRLVKKKSFSVIPKYAAICLLPLVLFIAPWAFRNYNLLGKLIPFQQDIYAGYNYYPSELRLRKLMTSMGEDGSTFWNPGTMASYFYPASHTTSRFTYPGYLKKDTVFLNKLEQARLEFISNYAKRNNQEEILLTAKAAELETEYRKEHIIRYYLLNPLKRVFTFWGHSGSWHLPRSNRGGIIKAIELGNKLLQSTLYFLVLVFGTWYLWKSRKASPFTAILLVPVIALTVLLPFVFGFMEPRYALSFYYPCLIGLVLFIASVQARLLKKE
ncbi:MAG: hypothetical protein ACT4OJ_11570 [Bacteroidota bacterium]